MVRLLRSKVASILNRFAVCFNPTMVRLLRVWSFMVIHRHQSFNPTMVRLLPLLAKYIEKARNTFQSHNGAIAARCPVPKVGLCGGFNPTMVRLLPTCVPALNYAMCLRFNPTMVRLLRDLDPIVIALPTRVSIPQWCDCCGTCLLPYFVAACVSIPQWCDCCEWRVVR